MHYETTYKLENFILNTRWEDVPEEVKMRIKGCLLDLTGALIVGSRSGQFTAGLKLAEQVFPAGDIPVIGSDKTFGVLGAAAAMGHASNAYDIDDGHNMTRAHPGTSVIGGLLVLGGAPNLSISRMALDISIVVAFLNMTKQFTGNVNQVSQQINAVVMALAGAERIFTLMDEPPEQDDGYVTLVDAEIAPDGTVTEAELAAHGVNICIYANQLTRSAFPAMQQTAEDILRYHRAKEVDDRLMSIKNIITLIDEL